VFDAENEHSYAAEVYLKLDDISALMALHIRQQDWDAAVKLSEEHAGKFDKVTRENAAESSVQIVLLLQQYTIAHTQY
jgi:hypothetical protein